MHLSWLSVSTPWLSIEDGHELTCLVAAAFGDRGSVRYVSAGPGRAAEGAAGHSAKGRQRCAAASDGAGADAYRQPSLDPHLRGGREPRRLAERCAIRW